MPDVGKWIFSPTAMISTQNPFPGMNPWLQRKWSDVHTMLIAFIKEVLTPELPSDLAAYAEERIALIADGGELVNCRGDVAITEPWRHGIPPVWTPESDAAAVSATERWVEILDTDGRLITVIEVLSPANKTREAHVAYTLKAQRFLAAGVNLVEIDLVRGGMNCLQIEAELLPRTTGTTYYICVSRGLLPQRREVYPCPLRQRLPAIRIPLRPTDPDIPLDLQPLIDRCYALGRYWRNKWLEPINPPLPEDDAAWAAEQLKAAGLVE
jgi:hypothetical protein